MSSDLIAGQKAWNTFSIQKGEEINRAFVWVKLCNHKDISLLISYIHTRWILNPKPHPPPYSYKGRRCIELQPNGFAVTKTLVKHDWIFTWFWLDKIHINHPLAWPNSYFDHYIFSKTQFFPPNKRYGICFYEIYRMSSQAIYMLIYKMKQLADEPNYAEQMKLICRGDRNWN